jgi:hypothetical protein
VRRPDARQRRLDALRDGDPRALAVVPHLSSPRPVAELAEDHVELSSDRGRPSDVIPSLRLPELLLQLPDATPVRGGRLRVDRGRIAVWEPAPLAGSRQGERPHQLEGVELAPRMAEQLGEVTQSHRVADPHEPAHVGNRPVLAFEAQDCRIAGSSVRRGRDGLVTSMEGDDRIHLLSRCDGVCDSRRHSRAISGHIRAVDNVGHRR